MSTLSKIAEYSVPLLVIAIFFGCFYMAFIQMQADKAKRKQEQEQIMQTFESACVATGGKMAYDLKQYVCLK